MKQKQINMKTEKRNLEYLQERAEVTKKEMKAENLVDDFVKQWREKNNTEDAVYCAYQYDAMVAFAEYFKEISNRII